MGIVHSHFPWPQQEWNNNRSNSMLNYTKRKITWTRLQKSRLVKSTNSLMYGRSFSTIKRNREEIAAFLQRDCRINDYIKCILTINSHKGLLLMWGDTLGALGSLWRTQVISMPLRGVLLPIGAYLKKRCGDCPCFQLVVEIHLSMATVDLAKAIWRPLSSDHYMCCRRVGTLKSLGDDHNLLLLRPSCFQWRWICQLTSYTSMMLTALLVFSPYRICWHERFWSLFLTLLIRF